MAPTPTARARIVLLGLDESLASELERILRRQHQVVYSEPGASVPDCAGLLDRLGADLVFCPSDRAFYLALLEIIGRHKPDLPVVVVSRTPEVSEWLDAIEAGASDYCAAPFEAGQIQWILDSTLKHRSAPLLYRTA